MLTFLIVLSILVLVHELGHYIAAKRMGIWVEEFGFGLPPKLFGIKIGETVFSLNLLPFGGFCRMHGESVEEGIEKPRKAFINRSKKVRSLVIVSGVIMNFILAVVAFAIVYSFSGIPKETGRVMIVDVLSDTPASTAQLKVGDEIISVDGKKVSKADEVTNLITSQEGKHKFVFETGAADARVQRKLTLEGKKDDSTGKWYIGVVLTSTEMYLPPIWQRPFLGMYYGFKDAVGWGGEVIGGFAGIFKDLFSGKVPDTGTGPIGIYAITSQVAKFGILAVINLIGILSVNLMILNILPFPALDGGRLLFIGVESVIGKKIVPKVEATIHTIGMIFLIILLLAITFHDIQRIIAAGSISKYVESMLK